MDVWTQWEGEDELGDEVGQIALPCVKQLVGICCIAQGALLGVL